MKSRLQKVSIIGLGLIGASIAAGLKQRGLADRIIAYDTNAESLETGISRALIDEKADSVAACVQGSSLVVLAVPVLSIRDSLSQLKDVLLEKNRSGQAPVVTDVGSVKSTILKAANEIFGEHPANLVPGHPVAGSEKHGVEAADPDLFEKHKVILTPTASTDKDALGLVEEMWQGLGARVMQMTAEHHDSVFAQTSHLPHLLAYALVDTLSVQGDSLEIFEYAAGGFRDFSRIAASDPVMWRDVFDANGEEVLNILDRYVDELSAIRTLIADGRMEELEQLFKRAKIARDHFSSISQGKRK
ncbi:MAG: prephenate dehydrogenase/arogenate dehydrogenase family protein [Proteobacteria bacterium]|nr:prephenate dehydrogenase/arogenate dehydrogenase family protein [Pseudomonadota bacterium]